VCSASMLAISGGVPQFALSMFVSSVILVSVSTRQLVVFVVCEVSVAG
jgi:hypothetical protein